MKRDLTLQATFSRGLPSLWPEVSGISIKCHQRNFLSNQY